MIARRDRRRRRGPILRPDAGQLVVGTAKLERAGALQGFRLEQDTGAEPLVERGRFDQRRFDDQSGETRRGSFDIAQLWQQGFGIAGLLSGSGGRGAGRRSGSDASRKPRRRLNWRHGRASFDRHRSVSIEKVPHVPRAEPAACPARGLGTDAEVAQQVSVQFGKVKILPVTAIAGTGPPRTARHAERAKRAERQTGKAVGSRWNIKVLRADKRDDLTHLPCKHGLVTV